MCKRKACDGMPYDCFTKLYLSLIQPFIDYGASIWKARPFSFISSVHHRVERLYPGPGKCMPNCTSR